MEKIDLVVTWVDGEDDTWLKEKSKYQSDGLFETADIASRYRKTNLFKYFFRGIENNAPWINKVFFITYGHLPEWLDTSHPKLRIVRHDEYIPKEYLPTYNSNVIELNLHRIAELSEKFILFNDDMYLLLPVRKEDFFQDNKVKDLAIYRYIVPVESFNHIELNNTIIMNKYFDNRKSIKNNIFKFFRLRNGRYNINNFFALLHSNIIGYKTGHVSQPHFKSTFKEVWQKEEANLSKMCLNKFRSATDYSHFLMAHWNIESNEFVPQDLDFGKYFSANQVDEISVAIKNKKYKVICINDDVYLDNFSYESISLSLEKIFNERFPEKSSFEK